MLRIQEESGRCLRCGKPRCSAGCPIGTPIPEMIALFKEGKTREAAQRLFENNPLSLICSIVCNHEGQCEGHCVRGIKSTPVQWSAIERYISDTCFDRVALRCPPPSSKSVAVIGSGPAGLTAAIVLAQKGHEVTVFEAENEIGGMLRYGIPGFRLPKSILDRYEKKMKQSGIHFRYRTAIGITLTIDTLLQDGYDAVMIGSGLWKAKALGIPGESLPNVCYGIHYLISPESFDLGERVAVIGMGNTAMDVARTALHHGANYVTMYARSNRCGADDKERELAQMEGAELMFGQQITRITRQGPIFRACRPDENGRLVFAEEEVLYPADFTIIAAGQEPKNKLINTTEGLEGTDRGLLKVDEQGMTTVPGVFASGDVVHGGKTVVEAAAEAKRVALAIDAYLGGNKQQDP